MTKALLKLAAFSLAILLFAGCEKDKSESNDVGGDQSTMGEVGNDFSISSSIGVENISATVESLSNGVSNIKVEGTITDSTLKKLADLIPSWKFGTYDPGTGSFSADLKMKFTTEGIVDYLNADEKPFTLVKFDAEVGDEYTAESASGGTFKRTVSARSEEDDFPYGFFYIKTITVEEPGRDPAVKKIIYKLNHKFGLVHATVQMQDGSEMSTYVYSVAENK